MADNEDALLIQMCKSLRFENQRNCQSKSLGKGYCLHHMEIYDYLEEGFNFRSRFHKRNIYMEDEQDYQAISEVEEYMWRFRESIMNPTVHNAQNWWIISRVPLVRAKRKCRSLNLLNGSLCSSNVSYPHRYCNYHWLQHDVLCTEYHPRDREELSVLNDSTKSFIEFILRKEFDLIYGYAGKYESDIPHRKRYGFLVDNMFEQPYCPNHLLDLDPEYTRDAKLWSGILNRENPTCKCF